MTQTVVTYLEVITFPDGRMDTKNTSTYTGLSEKTLAMMRCNGNGPKFVKRGRIFYFTADVDEWMNSQGRLTSTTQAKQRPA
jgi:predicted DNA-binding transcriptional regulator AlpA